MVTKIIAHNFQSHKHTEVSLDKGLTVFIGDSDQGKTALVKRAFLWCLFNEPNGNSFVRYKDDGKVSTSGERERENLCYVTVEFDNGYSLTRKREKNKNTYELLNEDGEILCFEGFKNEVPSEIQEALSISKFIIDEDLKFNVNVIGSRDVSLVDLNGNIKSKVIGAFAGTNIIDIANRGVVSDIKSSSGNFKNLIGEKEKLEEKVNQYDNLEKREKLLSFIKEKMEEYRVLSENKNKIIALRDKFYEVLKRKKEIDLILESEQKVLEAEKTLENIESLKDSLNVILEKKTTLENLYNQYSANVARTKELIEVIDSEKNVTKYEIIISDIENKLSEMKTLSEKQEKLSHLLTVYKENFAKLQKAKKIIDSEPKLVIYEKKVNILEEKVSIYSSSIKNLIDKGSKIQEYAEKYKKSVASLNAKKTEIELSEKQLKSDIADYISTIKEFGTCPMCMQPITPEHLTNITTELFN